MVLTFDKKEKKLKQGIVVLGKKAPEIGDLKLTKKFAWIPVRINFDTHSNIYNKNKKEYVWLENYYKKERWSKNLKRMFYNHNEYCMGYKWVENNDWNHIDNVYLKK